MTKCGVSSLYVIKRDGRSEPFNFAKVEKVVKYAAEGLNIDISEFFNEFQFLFRNGITTKELQTNLINTANKMVYRKGQIRPEYSILANRLFLMDFWKEIRLQRETQFASSQSDDDQQVRFDEYGMFKRAEHWVEYVRKLVELGIYDERLLKISKDVMAKLYVYAKELNRERGHHFMWNNFIYQSQKFVKSYLIHYEGKPVETFDEALLLLSILGFYKDYRYDKELFIKNVQEFYKHLTDYHFIPATPQLLNLRRAYGNLSSCNILDIHDNIESIYYSLTQCALISKNAGGIGVYAGRLRPSGSYLMGNRGQSNDVRLWFKLLEDTAIAVNQGGNRKGAITIALPIWHKDVVEFIASRKPLGEKRLKLFDIFQQVVVPSYFIEKVKEKGDWYLVDHYEIQKVANELGMSIDLIDTYGDEFKENYQKVEELIKQGKLKNFIKIKATQLLQQIFDAFLASGFPYIFFEDNANDYSPFKEKIHCGNLCVESFSPFRNTNPEGRKPHEGIPDDQLGYVHSCNLFSLNLPKLYEDGILFDDKKLNDVMKLVVRYMDNILEIANPPIEEIYKHNSEYRTIGIGYLGFADLMVKLSMDENQLYTYQFTNRSIGDEQKKQELKDRVFGLIKRVFGRIAFYGMKASIQLAKERGYAPKYKQTKWHDGILLGRFDTNRLSASELSEIFCVDESEVSKLLRNLKRYGIRNTMLFNAPPNTSTSLYAGVSASIFPPYNVIQAETQKKGTYITFPRYVDVGLLYYHSYINSDDNDMYDITEIVAEIQKYIDSGISFEYVINRDKLKGRDLVKFLYKFFMKSHKLGIKALYYARSRTTSNNGQSTNGKDGKSDCIACAN